MFPLWPVRGSGLTPYTYLVCSTSLLTCPETDKLKPEPVRRSIAARLASKSATSSLVLRDGSGCSPSLGRAPLSGCLVKRPVSGSSKRRSSALTPGLISIAPSAMTDVAEYLANDVHVETLH